MRRHFLSLLLGCVLCFLFCSACSSQDSNVQQSSATEYYNVQANQKDIGTPSQDNENWRFLNAFFYQGKPTQVWYVKNDSADDLIDVYLYREDEGTELLVSGVPEEYRGTWFLDEEGNIYITTDEKFTQMGADGIIVYSRMCDSGIYDICQMGDGTIVLLIQSTDGIIKLAVLDTETGKLTEKTNIKLDDSTIQYISGGIEGLMLLNTTGLWSVDLAAGSMECLLEFEKIDYQLEWGLSDFYVVDEKNIELLYNNKVESIQIGTIEQEKEIIIVRNWYDNPHVRKYIDAFNLQSEKYRAVLEVPSELKYSSEFKTQTNIEIANGEGADVLISGVILDAESYIQKGVLENLKPYMDASGIREEDFFPIAFDTYRDREKIYGICVRVGAYGFCLDSSLMGTSEEPNVEMVVDAMLIAPEDAILQEYYTSGRVLKYFLEGSESLLGTVDWASRKCNFDNELFIKLLKASKLHGYDEKSAFIELADDIIDGNFFTFETKEDLVNKGKVKVGYFFDDGYRVANNSSDVWVINSNAKNKEGAWELLSFMLSEDFQTSIDVEYPTNRQAFEKVAAREREAGPIQQSGGGISYKAGTDYYRAYGKEAYIERFKLTDEKVDEIRQQVENTKALPYRIVPLLDIILEEAEYYFNDTKSIEEVIPIIENRVQLYLDEQ